MINYSLYLCTDSSVNKRNSLEENVREAIIGGVTVVQLREKNKSSDELYLIAKKIKKITDEYNVPLIINDNVDVALKINADGVHIGQDDIPCYKARKILGENKIVGVTVTTLDQAKKAIEEGATYLGVGAIYKSRTKKDAIIVSPNEFDKIMKFSTIPVVVIGGINKHTIPNFKKYNVSGYAMIRPILQNRNIIKSTIKLKKIIMANMDVNN